jgi:hypothetical protein
MEGSSTPKFSRLRRHMPISDRPDALFGKMARLLGDIVTNLILV